MNMEKQVALLCFIWTTARLPDIEATKGREFLVTFPFTPFAEVSFSVTAVGVGPITVNATTPRDSTGLNVSMILSKDGDLSQRVVVKSGLIMSESSKYPNFGIQIKSDGDITVHTASRVLQGHGRTSMYSVLVLPLDHLSTHYVAFTSCDVYHCFVAIGSPFQSVKVTVRLRIKDLTFTSNTIVYRSVEYRDGSILSEILDAYEVMQILSDRRDLTGTEIRSTHPVVVVSGGEFSRIKNKRKDAVVEQIPPVCSLGKRFILATLPSVTTVVYVVFVDSFTRLEYDKNKLALSTTTDTHQSFNLKSSPVTLTTNTSVLVLLTPISGTKSQLFDPALTLVMPVNIWTSRYTLTCTFNHMHGAFVYVVIYTCKGCDELFFTFNKGTEWEPSLSWKVTDDFQTTSILLPEICSGKLDIWSKTCNFGGYIMGLHKALGWANPFGWDSTVSNNTKSCLPKTSADNSQQQLCEVIPESSRILSSQDKSQTSISASTHIPSMTMDIPSTRLHKYTSSPSYNPSRSSYHHTSPTPTQSVMSSFSKSTVDPSESSVFSYSDIATVQSSYTHAYVTFSSGSSVYKTPQLSIITASTSKINQGVSSLDDSLTESTYFTAISYTETTIPFTNTPDALSTSSEISTKSSSTPSTLTTRAPEPTEGPHTLKVCPCSCNNMKKTKNLNVSHEVEEEMKNEIKKELEVSKTDLSSTVRRKASAVNKEISSTYLGSIVAISVFVVTLATIIGPDALVLTLFVYRQLQLLFGNG